jgi:hypothetical protein
MLVNIAGASDSVWLKKDDEELYKQDCFCVYQWHHMKPSQTFPSSLPLPE